MKNKLTEASCQKWLMRNSIKVERYLRKFHKYEDRPFVFSLIFYDFPLEGKKLMQNFDLSNEEKLDMICDYVIDSEQLTGIVFGDQRTGKDVTTCFIIHRCIERAKKRGIKIRVVTLGNIKKPPFVSAEDMYFGYDDIPPEFNKNFIIVYCSEVEVQYPSREGGSKENKTFSILEGTMAQNHHKLLACVKLASKVDLNVIRGCNIKFFKFIDPAKLDVEGTERTGILSGLGKLLLPSNKEDKSEVLVSFDNNLLKVNIPLPDWWSQEYSEMFSNISIKKIYEYVDWAYSNEYTVSQIVLAVKQKFRKKINKQDIKVHLQKQGHLIVKI